MCSILPVCVYYSTVGVHCTHRHARVHAVAALVTIAIQPSTDHDCISAIDMYACNCVNKKRTNRFYKCQYEVVGAVRYSSL